MIICAFPRITFGYKQFVVPTLTNKPLFDSVFVLDQSQWDEIHLELASHFSLKYLDKDNCEYVPSKDLIYPAILYLEAHFGIKVNLKIVVRKNVSTNAGLASYAACAGAVVEYLMQKHKLPLNLITLAQQVDCNIPFYITKLHAARVSGSGEHIKPLVNVIFPKFKLHYGNVQMDTNLVFQHHAIQPLILVNDYINKLIENLIKEKPYLILNELEPSILNLYPEIASVKANLKTKFNQVFICGLSSTFIEIEDAYFAKNVTL